VHASSDEMRVAEDSYVVGSDSFQGRRNVLWATESDGQ
jgi:hypothetical protein